MTPAGSPRRSSASAGDVRRRPPTADDPDALQRARCSAARCATACRRGRKRRLEVARQGDGPALPVRSPILSATTSGSDRGPADADRPRTARRRSERAPQPRPVRRAARHCDRGAARAQRSRAPRGSLRGAVVTGLGSYDGALSLTDLTEAVRAGVLRYLLQVVDVLGKADREVSLATVLLGYNSSANLTVDGFGRSAGARRDRRQCEVLRDDAAQHPHRASSTSSSSTSTPRSPPSTHCADSGDSSRAQAEQQRHAARLQPASCDRATARASACSTTAVGATGRA